MRQKIIWTIGAVFLILLFVFINFIGSAPALPEKSNEIIDKLIDASPPPLHLGQTGFADNDGVNIWYESFMPKDTVLGHVLLIMGHSTTGINWSEYFYRPLVDSGYQVIRYDNRGVGLSDWIEDWNEENAYDLKHMVGDALAIMDDLSIEKVHAVGASMGGMIAQQMAIDHEDRLLSLTSIMSSGDINDPALPPVPTSFVRDFQKLGLRYLIFPSESNLSRFNLGVTELLSGDGRYGTEVSAVVNRTLFELRERKGFNPKVGDQHTIAIEKSGSRYALLGQIEVPTLVIHGVDDPLVPFEHGQKHAALIPNADTLWVEGMGHDIPRIYVKEVHQAMFQLFKKSSL